MMTYKYINVENDGGRMQIRITTKFTGHRGVIDAQAEQGYRYVGFIPTEMNGHGLIISMDLIFEKEVG